MQVEKENRLTSTMKELVLFGILFGIVLFVNMPLISLDVMYPEQPTVYIANQSIHSVWDLIKVFIHPKLLHASLPFFRPSGLFLMYQLTTPLIGWHNTKALMIINLFFLALTGYALIKLYNLLFPNFKIGGYVAFSIYLMHPALILSRLVILHFEFAYVFFSVASLMLFVRFIRENTTIEISQYQDPTYRFEKTKALQFKHQPLFMYAILLFAIAITFNELAVMMGLVFLAYFLIHFYNKQSILSYSKDLIKNRDMRNILLVITLTTLILGIYLTMAWPTLQHPLRKDVDATKMMAAIRSYVQIIFPLKYNWINNPKNPDLIWYNVVFPLITRMLLWLGLLTALLATIIIDRSWQNTGLSVYRRSLTFLYVAFAMGLIIPINWAMSLAWHLSLSLVFLSLIMGFSFEYLCQFIIASPSRAKKVGLCLALCIALSTLIVNHSNIHQIFKPDLVEIGLASNRNAVYYPPHIQPQLKPDSVIIEEDSTLHSDYLLGNSGYPFHMVNAITYNRMTRNQWTMFIKYQPIFNGTLFRMAYLMPTLREEVYPFRVENMNAVQNEIIYDWLQLHNNVFCLGYDSHGEWHDKTADFKKNLFSEKLKRHMIVNRYQTLPMTAMSGSLASVVNLPFPDHQLCQYRCDQNSKCKGFTFTHIETYHRTLSRCYFFNNISLNTQNTCPACTGFIKTTK